MGYYIFAGLAWLAIFFGVVYGYVENIIKLIQACSGTDVHFTLMILIRIIGVFTGIVGVIAGYF